MPDPSEDHGVMLTLEESGTGWDQFAVNEQKFGVRSTYDEHFYTTKIDKNNCAISEAQASRIAREIMQESLNKGGLADYHIAEERGFEIDDKVCRTCGTIVHRHASTLASPLLHEVRGTCQQQWLAVARPARLGLRVSGTPCLAQLALVQRTCPYDLSCWPELLCKSRCLSVCLCVCVCVCVCMCACVCAA